MAKAWLRPTPTQPRESRSRLAAMVQNFFRRGGISDTADGLPTPAVATALHRAASGSCAEAIAHHSSKRIPATYAPPASFTSPTAERWVVPLSGRLRGRP
jgi:hypothetical protein